MKLLDFNFRPTDRQLRQFGAISLFALPLVGWIWGASTNTLGVLAAVGAVIALAGWAMPTLIKPLFLGLMIVATPIGLVVGEIAMIIIYFGMFLPLAIAFRIMGRDALALRMDRDASSHWRKKQPPRGPGSYYHQS